MSVPETTKDFHHAYVVSGTEALPALRILEQRGIVRVGNPDVVVWNRETLGVEDARALVHRALVHPTESSVQYFVVTCAAITREAQNALLKVLEEPTGSSVFFFVLPYPDMLLETLKSRVHIIYEHEHIKARASVLDPVAFLSAAPAARLKMLSCLLPKKGEERDMRAVLGFLHALEMLMNTVPKTSDMLRGLRALYNAKLYITDRGASLKILLEYVALLVPQVSAR